MFTMPGLFALLTAHYTKLHEVSPVLHQIPVVPFLYVASIAGVILDLRLRLVHAEACPQLWIALVLWFWTLLSVLLTGGLIGFQINLTLVYMLVFVLASQSIQTFRGLRALTLCILVLSMFLGAVTFVQAMSPFQCIRLQAGHVADSSGSPDGRQCESASECRVGAAPGEDFLCERPGPLDTTSIGHGRVRYRGILQDPNELAVALVITLPFALVFFSQHPSLLSFLILAGTFAITVPVVIWTASRTGQIAFTAVMAAYILRRIGWKQVLAVAALAMPALLLGGRSGGEADQSSLERLEAWQAGMRMLKSSPLWGVGKSQFVEHHYITAHNTFVLQTAELGFVGLILWVAVFYTGFKIVLSGIRRYRDRPEQAMAYTWARALLASFSGILVGTSFLSLGYHPVVWAFFALPGAYYLAVRRHDPGFRVSFGVRDLVIVTGFSVTYLAGLNVYLFARGMH